MTIPADASRTGKSLSGFVSSLVVFARECAATVSAATIARLAKLERKQQQRRDLAELAGLPDELLRDMGATRGDIELELRDPSTARGAAR